MQLEKGEAEPQVPQRYFRQLESNGPMSIAKGDLSRVGCAADTFTFPVIFEDSWGTERDCKRQ